MCENFKWDFDLFVIFFWEKKNMQICLFIYSFVCLFVHLYIINTLDTFFFSHCSWIIPLTIDRNSHIRNIVGVKGNNRAHTHTRRVIKKDIKMNVTETKRKKNVYGFLDTILFFSLTKIWISNESIQNIINISIDRSMYDNCVPYTQHEFVSYKHINSSFF